MILSRNSSSCASCVPSLGSAAAGPCLRWAPGLDGLWTLLLMSHLCGTVTIHLADHLCIVFFRGVILSLLGSRGAYCSGISDSCSLLD